ncbi:MAG: DNA-binding protein [Candidatus Omnitrophota bacterium]
MAITKEQIIETAEALQAKGINPTMQAVRDAMDGKGSFATISPVLRAWRDSKSQRATVALDMPGEAKAALERAGTDLWRIVTALATERLTKVQEEAETAVNGAQADRDEALAEIERLEAGIEQTDGELAEALAANEVSTNALNDALEEIRALEIQLADKARIEADNTRLMAELAELRTENKALVDEKFVLVGQMKDVENALSRTEKELAKTLEQLNDKDGQIKEKDVQADKLQAENNTYNLQTQKLQIALDASETKAAELKAEVADLRKTIGDREREAGALAGELKAVTAENKELKGLKVKKQ